MGDEKRSKDWWNNIVLLTGFLLILTIIVVFFLGSRFAISGPESDDILEAKGVGDVVSPEDYPWMVGVALSGTRQRCGGVLISRSFVLTAAHCLELNPKRSDEKPQFVSPERIKVYGVTKRFGDRSLALDPDWTPEIHPKYLQSRKSQSEYDVALLRLAKPVPGAVTTAPIAIQRATATAAIVSGWGLARGDDRPLLRAVKVPISKKNRLCRDELPTEFFSRINWHTICAIDAKADTCSGDSGGPLVIGTREKPQTIGIVSWGYNRECGVPVPGRKLVGVYARASSVTEWIRATTGDATALTTEPAGELMPVF